MFPLVLSVAALGPAQPAGHETANPLYKQMLDRGVAVGLDIRVVLPPPAMPDGLDAAGQKAVIRRLIGSDYSYEEFTRRSVVAPQLLRITDPKPSDPAAPARGFDVYFVAYGDFKATEDDKFLERVTGFGKGKGGKGRGLTREELAARNITLKPDHEGREGYGQIEFDFLEKVRLKFTGHAMWSKTPESVLAAAEVDPRFRSDSEFPNEWRPLTKEGGTQKAGPPQPYGGAGMYLKVTRMAEPPGAMFIEQHVVFAEPHGWFDGANLLRSKLPLVVRAAACGCRAGWPAHPGTPPSSRP